MPLITTEETKWLKLITELLRIQTNHIINTGGSGLLASFIVGGAPPAPANGETEYFNPALDGKSIIITKNGFGYLTEGTDYTLITGGGFELVAPAVFTTSEKYLIFEE